MRSDVSLTSFLCVASTGLGTDVAPRGSGGTDVDSSVSGFLFSATNSTRRRALLGEGAVEGLGDAPRDSRISLLARRSTRPGLLSWLSSDDLGPGDLERLGDRAWREPRFESCAWLGNTAETRSSMESSESSNRSDRFSSETSPSPSRSRRTSRSRSRTRARYRSDAVHAAPAFTGLDCGVARGVTCGDTRGERTVVPNATACVGTRRAEGDGSRDRARPPSTEARRDAALVLARGAGISPKNALDRRLAAGSSANGGRPRLILAGSLRRDGVSEHHDPLVRCGRPGAAHVVRAMRARRPPRHHSHPP